MVVYVSSSYHEKWSRQVVNRSRIFPTVIEVQWSAHWTWLWLTKWPIKYFLCEYSTLNCNGALNLITRTQPTYKSRPTVFCSSQPLNEQSVYKWFCRRQTPSDSTDHLINFCAALLEGKLIIVPYGKYYYLKFMLCCSELFYCLISYSIE